MRTSGRSASAAFSFRNVAFNFAFCAALTLGSSGQTLTTLHNFAGGMNDGAQPTVGVVQAGDGNFYGVTSVGGAHSAGTIFRITPNGTITILHSFGVTDGIVPESPIVLGSDGNIWGTASPGGGNSGTVFKCTLDGTFSVVHAFNGNDGAGPAGLTEASDGNFYGTTGAGLGPYFYGTVFKMTPSGTVTTLYAFQNTDGATPIAGVIQGRDGNFYGTTKFGGSGCGTNGCGTVFKMTPSGTLTTLHFFDASDGQDPVAVPVQGADGVFYGTALSGGGNGGGTVYKVTSSGTFTTLYRFCAQLTCPDGFEPFAPLIQASDGNFYGTTSGGGYLNYGTVFKITPAGALTSVYLFHYSEGAEPYGALLQASDGNFYGTTVSGGSNSQGTVFRLSGPPLIQTTTTLTTAPNPSQLNQTVIMTATVHAQNGTAVGNVVFSSDGVGIGTVALNNSGVAVLNYSSLPLGPHAIVAVYQGGNGFSGSTSNIVQQVVQLAASTTTVTSAPNPSTFGQSVMITATVGPAGPPMPTGTVSFTSNAVAISGCTALPLTSLTAVCTTSTLAVGTDAIVASYSGDSNYSPSSGMLSQLVNPIPSPLQFVAVTPCRVYDTRPGHGGTGAIPGGSFANFILPQLSQSHGCGDLSLAVAYSLNVTAIPHGRLGYLSIWPTGEGQPVVSTMNSPDGRVKADAVIVPAGNQGGIAVYVTDTADVALDIDGYFAPATASTLEFYPLTPCRVADTRLSNFPPGLGQPELSAGLPRVFPVLNSSCIPAHANAAAYSFNFTVVPGGHPVGYLSVWPSGQNQPVVSTLNDQTGTIVANAAIVPAGASGSISAFATDNTQLLIDIDGYFAPAGAGGLSLYPVAPCRVLDTRHAGGAFSGELTVDVLHSMCAPPATAQAYVFNATVVPPASLGYLTLWPDGQMQPVVSTLNAPDGSITSNLAIVPASTAGKIDAFAANGITQLILDISSYFAP